MYHLINIIRNPSNGSEFITVKQFETIEEASEYVRTDWYDAFCSNQEEWDDYDVPFPKREDFTVCRVGTVFAAYNTYYAITEFELRLQNGR